MNDAQKYKSLKSGLGDSTKITPEAECLQRYLKARKEWDNFYKDAQDDLKFLNGDQWTSEARRAREGSGRPVLTLPRTTNFIRRLESDIRKTETSIQVVARTNASKEEADALSNIVRSIESNSVASNAYTEAGKFAIRTGLGFIRVYSDYPHYTSFEQDLFISAVTDPTRVLFDPASRGVLLEDAQYVFVESVMAKSAFMETVASPSARERIRTNGFKKYSDLVIDEESVMLLEYFYKVSKGITIYKYANPRTGEILITEDQSEVVDLEMMLVNSRRTTKTIINHCLFDGMEFYNKTEFPGDKIPIVPVFGETSNINGELIIKGAITDCKDAQRLLNYAASVEVEVIDSAPKAPWLIAEGSIDGYEYQWANSNIENFGFLMYKPKPNLPIPSRAPYDTNIAAISTVKAQAESDLQNIFGVFDSQLGAPSPEVSGVAINARNESAQKSTFVYRDNLNRSISQVGQILVDSIPTYYNGRTVTTLSANGTDIDVRLDISDTSSFQVNLKSGMSSETQRETLSQQLLQIMQVLPAAAPLLADIVVKNSNLIGSDPVVTRLKTLLPPEIVASESKETTPENAQVMLAQAAQQIQQLNAAASETETALAQCQQELALLKADRTLDDKKITMDYDIKNKDLQLRATELELDFEIKTEELRVAEAKLISERQGVQHDTIQPIN